MASISGFLRQNVLGLIAIFLALTGSAYAITSKTVFNQDLGNGSVDSRVIADGGVAGIDIQRAAVGPAKLKLEKLVKYLQTRVNAKCADGESMQGILADGSVICAPDQVNAGTITGITTEPGLTGGGRSGDVSIGIDPSVVQSRVSGGCPANQAVRSVAQDGTVACDPDDVNPGTITGVTTSGGLTGGGTSGSVALGTDPSVLQSRVDTGCTGTTAVQSVDAAGQVTCSQSLAAASSFLSAAQTLNPNSGGVDAFNVGGIRVRVACGASNEGRVVIDNVGATGTTVLYTSHSTSQGDLGDALAPGAADVIGVTSAKELVSFSARSSSGTLLDGTLQAWSPASNPLGAQCQFSGWAFAH